MKERNVYKAIYWIKEAWNGVKCNTIAKCFKKCGFVDNTAENLAEELFGATVDELHEIDVSNEESDDDDDNEIDFNLVVKKGPNYSINELIKAESLLKTSDDAEINWEANICGIIEALDEKEKAESEEERDDATHDYSTDTVISSFPTALNHVIYLKQFLMNKGFTDVVEDLSKVESKLENKFVKQQQRATQTSITDFFGLS